MASYRPRCSISVATSLGQQTGKVATTFTAVYIAMPRRAPTVCGLTSFVWACTTAARATRRPPRTSTSHAVCTGHHRLTAWSLLALREAPSLPGCSQHPAFDNAASLPDSTCSSQCCRRCCAHDDPANCHDVRPLHKKTLETMVGIRPELAQFAPVSTS